ncbi:MAG: polyprenyl synthetase family protein [Acetatifactor sp.]|nr:polyprenyl synthetase family protein [Acetatifactor sp.]
MDKSKFKTLLTEKTNAINEMLEHFLPEEKGMQVTVIEAMNYSVRVGGKRLRPMFMQETFTMCGGTEAEMGLLEPFMAALEMIHTYSLVHDDLPAMDNDTLRRGNPTTWYKYGETAGILAGDGLLNYAFETAAKALGNISAMSDLAPEKKAELFERATKALTILGRKAGIFGMVGGQVADLEAEGKGDAVSEEMLLFIHENKTAALIQAAMTIGAVLAGADASEIDKLEKCAYNIGIAFQIQDDILDVIGDTAELGKTVGSDEENDKQTYVRLKGLETAKRDVAALSAEAIQILDSFEKEHEFLSELVNQLIDRRK